MSERERQAGRQKDRLNDRPAEYGRKTKKKKKTLKAGLSLSSGC